MSKYENTFYLQFNRQILHEPYKTILSKDAVYLFLILKELEQQFCTADKHEFYRSDEDLAKDAKMSLKTLKKHKAELKKYASDLIEITSKPIWDEKNKKFSQSKITHYYIY
jgi:hypothetical protein